METDEDQQIEAVTARLTEHNPGISPEIVATTVDEVRHRFDGCLVRVFVPLLVERLADDKLANYTRSHSNHTKGSALASTNRGPDPSASIRAQVPELAPER
ncbi:three-helix bundle dimerization domain-containing protein [Nocardia sp. NPDC059240]|uniref:three-helix bundle dimerization domain-containing protein n=1 Tax=Nocardia sp. NPDC059240 TaxID=3346786 RepID=UPI0036CB10A3